MVKLAKTNANCRQAALCGALPVLFAVRHDVVILIIEEGCTVKAA